VTRATYRFRDHTIRPDTTADAEPITFTMQCAACGTIGPTHEDADQGADWAIRHLKANPEHLAYREHITRPYRTESGAWR
jgi:hypothetical protein